MTADMPPYNPEARCPKCHSTDIAAQWVALDTREMQWHRDPAYFMGRSGVRMEMPTYYRDEPEHILRTCRWCKHEWKEEPLDVVREIDVRSYDE